MSEHFAEGSSGPGPRADEALIQLATEIAGYHSLAELLAHLPSHLRPLFPFDGVGLVLHDAATNDLRLVLALGGEAEDFPARVPVDYGPSGWVWQHQQSRVDILSGGEAHPTLQVLYESGFRSVLWLPLTTPRARLGTFVIARNTADPYGPEFDRLIMRATSLLALGVEHALQVESLERLGRQVAEERDRARGALSALGERVKELSALHETARLLQDERTGVRELLEQVAALLPPAFQFPDVTHASVRYGDIVVHTPGFVETPWGLAAPFITRDGTPGALEVCYADQRPAAEEGPFLREERRLLDSLAEMLTSALAKRAADAALRVGEERLRAARDRAHLLLEITNAVVSELDLRRLLDAVSKLSKEKIRHHFASIALWDESEHRLRRHALVFPTGKGTISEGQLVGIGTPAHVTFERGQTSIFTWPDVAALGERSLDVMTTEGLRTVCCLPLATARGRYGTLNIGKPDDEPFPPEEVELLEQIGRASCREGVFVGV